MRIHHSLAEFSMSRSKVFLGSLAVSCLLVCFTTVFLYAGQVRLVRRSEDAFVGHLKQTATDYMSFIQGGFAQSSELVDMVRRRDVPSLWRKFDEFQKGYAGAELLLSEGGREVFRAGDLQEAGPGLRGRIGRGESLEVGCTAVLYDDFGRAVSDVKVTYWLDLSCSMKHIESLAEGASLSSASRPGAFPVFPGVWFIPASVGQILLSILMSPAYAGLLVLQGVVILVAVLLLFYLLHQSESRVQRVVSLSGVLEEKDLYTMGHSDRVALFSERIAYELGVGRTTLKGLKLAALTHDLGKIFVPLEVLNNPGRLTEEEWRIIQRHPVDSERIFRKLLSNGYVAKVIRSHHERWDGKGYPDGLAGEDIPLGARVIAVADTFDAMTSKRPYREAMAVDKALRIIGENAGTQFDPEVVFKALNVLADIYDEIEWSVGERFSQSGKGEPTEDVSASVV